VTEAADGTSATASVSVVSLTVRVGPAIAPLATFTIDLLPLTAAAEAPVGGIDCPPPAPTVTEPEDGAVINDATPTYTGTGIAGATIDLTVDGTTIEDAATVDEDGNWEFTPTTELADGPHTVSATQTLDGATSVASAVNDFVVDTDAPDAPVITDPDEGSTITDNTPTVTGTGEPGATVTVAVDGEEIDDVTVDGDGNWELPLTDPLDDGEHTVSATQTDEAGNESAADDVTFVVDTEALPPVITAPADGSSTNDTTPTVVGTGEPGASVAVEIDGEPVGTVTVDGDGNWELPLTDPLDEGDHTVSAVQTDEAGNVSDPAENDFTVDTTAPAAPVITSPEDGDTIDDRTPTIEGTGEPGTTIVVIVDGEPVGEATVDEDGNWSLTLPDPLSDGDHTIEAVAVDEAGNESGSDSIEITVDVADSTDGGSGDRPELADTGGPSLGFGLVGAVLLVVGGTVLSLTRRRA
jgi:predicted  nucleic acid-binding Zn-ribbon protein